MHIASGIKCRQGVKIVELLLQANADPNTVAHDESVTHLLGSNGVVSCTNLICTGFYFEGLRLKL